MNSLNDVMNKFPNLYKALLLEYQINLHNDHVVMLIGKIMIPLGIAIVILTLWLNRKRDRWIDKLIFPHVIAGMLLVVGTLMWAVSYYDIWWCTTNKTLALWQMFLPQR